LYWYSSFRRFLKSELKDSGEQGRQKINQINRYIGIVLAFLQGFAMAFTFVKGAGTINLIYLLPSLFSTIFKFSEIRNDIHL